MFFKSVFEDENAVPPAAIIDGVIGEPTYFDSKYRIAWFLKEAYSSETEGFHKEHYGQENCYDNFFRNVTVPIWHPIIYTSFAILNNFIAYDDMCLKDDILFLDVYHAANRQQRNEEYVNEIVQAAARLSSL